MKKAGKIHDSVPFDLLKLELSAPVVALRRGMMSLIPLVMAGSIALALRSLPISGYQRFLKQFAGGALDRMLAFLQNGTLDILALLLVVAVAHAYAVEKNETRKEKLSPVIASLTALSSFIVFRCAHTVEPLITGLGNTKVAGAIIVTMLSSILFVRLSSMKIFGVGVYSADAYMYSSSILSSILPAITTIAFFALFGVLHKLLVPSDISGGWLGEMYAALVGKGPVLGSALLFVFLVHLMWCFGIHGSNVLEPLAQDLFVPALRVNQELIASGQYPTEIISKTFLDTFVLIGGSGATLCLVAGILFFGESRSQNRLIKLSALPLLLNVNELILFGIPIVFNPLYFIPFILLPVLLTASSFFAVFLGLVPHTINHVEWTTPVFISGYVATGSFRGVALQLFNLVLGVLCYLPFIRLAHVASEKKIAGVLERAYEILEKNPMRLSLRGQSEISDFLRFLLLDLENDLASGKLRLYYQSQVDHNGHVFGVEALLRWKHGNYGFIAPPLVVRLAESTGLIHKLGFWIVEQACADLARAHAAGRKDVIFSINVSPLQLEEEHFAETLLTIIGKHAVDPGSLKIEITEESALANGARVIEQLKTLVQHGVKLVMDDFGMGHTSLKYMREYSFDTIKIDGSIVRGVTADKKCADIIASIVSLGAAMSFSVVAEFVENEDQMKALQALGCRQYQGYLFGKPVPFEQMLEALQRGVARPGELP